VYQTPAIFAFDPFVGYFSGALYDTVIDLGPLLSYRAASLGTLFACYVVAAGLERGANGRSLHWGHDAPRGLSLVGGMCLAASLGSVALGAQLGHWQTRDDIRATLTESTSLGRCHVLHASRLRPEDAKRFARDCDAHARAIEAWLGTSGGEPVTVYFFSSAAEKRRLMGAARTSVAKPWRREIYLHAAGYPHPVVAHELVHALAAGVGHGPFAVAAHLGGWLPNPGLIEGLAVAASPPQGALTATEWSAAMLKRDILAPIEDLFSLRFFAKSSAAAYTVSGAFVAFIHARHGAATIRKWYAGAALTGLVDRSWAELDKAFRASLTNVKLSPAAVAQAKARFDRPGVLNRRCPHRNDRWLGEAQAALAAGDVVRGQSLYRGVLADDTSSRAARIGIARCLSRIHEAQSAAYLERLLDDKGTDALLKRSAYELRGDLALREGRVSEARADYQRALGLTTSEARVRTIEVKSHYAADAQARPALLALLIGTTMAGPRRAEALDRIGSWRANAPADGTPAYLLARQHFAAHDYTLASERLDEALARRLPVARVRKEAWRLRFWAACALEDQPALRRAYDHYLAVPGLTTAQGTRAKAWLQRCQPAEEKDIPLAAASAKAAGSAGPTASGNPAAAPATSAVTR
jgi:tetratricopeptide (TPR) repeat protein